MIDPVSSSLSFDASRGIEAIQAQKAVAPEPQAQSAITVELSNAAQARLLKSEGQTIPEIAMKLHLDEDRVSEYINQLV
jgi:hypothetical protein